METLSSSRLASFFTGTLLVFGLALNLTGCSGSSTATSPAVGPQSAAVKSGQKIAVPAPPDEKARAAGGSGMPAGAATGGGGGASSAPVAYIDAPPDQKAQALGGSGMPPIR